MNFIEEPFVTLTVNNKNIQNESGFVQCGKNDIKQVVVKHVDEATGKEIAERDIYQGYSISMIQGLGMRQKEIKDYTLVKTPVYNWDNDLIENGREYEYVYRYEPQKENKFADVRPNDYFYDAVLWAVGNGVTTGTSETTFSPAQSCTRAQAVTFLWRTFGSPEPENVENIFSDVSENAYYYKAVLWAVEEGITTGTSATTFAPERTVTRAEFVTFLWRAEGKISVVGSNPFTDVKSTNYFYDAVLWAVEEGITTGTTKTTFSPSETCIRGQVVSFIYRAK